MEKTLTALIFDKDKRSHDYNIETPCINDTVETRIDIEAYDEIQNANTLLSIVNKKRGVDCIITIGEEEEWKYLNILPISYRKKWVVLPEYDREKIMNSIVNVFLGNLNRETEEPLVSVITPTYNTKKDDLYNAYKSLIVQDYRNWEWIIVDDSTNAGVQDMINKMKDPRITVIKPVSVRHNIGYLKRLGFMSCNGKYGVELDHDDCLTPDALGLIVNKYKETGAGFVYSDCLELVDGNPINYGDVFSFGQGYYRDEEVFGEKVRVAVTCQNTNCKSIRGIQSAMNHVRTWDMQVYRQLGGHNQDLSVCDDYELLIRTFLNCRMAKIDKVLYIQNEYGQRGVSTSNTQSVRLKEIQRLNLFMRWKYDKAIHQRILDLGYEDQIWDEEKGMSDLMKDIDRKELINFDLK